MIKQHHIQVSDSDRADDTNNSIEYLPAKQTHSPGEKLIRNIALAGMLIIAVSSIRNAKLPDGETVLTAVQGIIDTQWDESLGKISFVSKMFPEAVSVFFSSPDNFHLTAPCFGEISHSWKTHEPYLEYDSIDGRVYAAARGQVMSLAHGMNDEKILRIRHTNDLESLYYNLSNVTVAEGDWIETNSLIGNCLDGSTAVIDVRRNGKSIDPTPYLTPRNSDSL